MQLKGKINVNDDAGLEKKADVLGAKALQVKFINPIVSTKKVLKQIQIKLSN